MRKIFPNIEKLNTTENNMSITNRMNNISMDSPKKFIIKTKLRTNLKTKIHPETIIHEPANILRQNKKPIELLHDVLKTQDVKTISNK